MNAIAAAAARLPDLTVDGVQGNARPDFAGRRAELLAAADQFERAVAWLKSVPATKVARQNSYVLKHAAQRWAGGYVSNGTMIAAALHLGLPIKVIPHSKINVLIGVAARSRWPKMVEKTDVTATLSYSKSMM